MSNKKEKVISSKASYSPVHKLSLEEATDAYNHLQREMATLVGFKDYHHRNIDNTCTLLPTHLEV